MNLWFGDEGNDKIGKSTTAGSITEFTVPPVMDESPEPTAITAGPGSALWFIEAYGGSDTIGEIPTTATVATPGIEQFTVPTAGAFATGIASGSDGNLWFTEQGANQIGKLTPAGTFSAYPLPDLDSFPAAITAGPDDNLWFTESDAIWGDHDGRDHHQVPVALADRRLGRRGPERRDRRRSGREPLVCRHRGGLRD